jgi:hypothetical protein
MQAAKKLLDVSRELQQVHELRDSCPGEVFHFGYIVQGFSLTLV